MAEVMLSIGGYQYRVACRDGGEPHLLEMAQLLDARVAEAVRTVGEMGEARQMLFAALLLADEVQDLRSRPPSGPAAELPAEIIGAVEQLALRVEKLADGLETGRVIS